ncbi:unnamed protein product, partial [Hapterophycus canaliculatus]
PHRSASCLNAAPPAWGEVVPVTTGSLAAKKRKSQESRLKRDTFLNQMSSFLEGLESSTPAEVISPEPPVSLATAESYTSAAFPSSAGSVAIKQASWSAALKDGPPSSSSGAYYSGAGPSSSLMQEGLFDPFLPKEVSPEVDKSQGGLRGVIQGASSGVSHQRGSLFDDDYVSLEDTGLGDTQDTNDQGRRQGNLFTSGPAGSSPQRASSPLPLSAPSHDARASLSQGRSSSKAKPSRGLDLEEVRRRTSLLSGEILASASAPAPSRPPATAGVPRPEAASSGEVPPHPLYAATPMDPLFPGSGSGGNYFNED